MQQNSITTTTILIIKILLALRKFIIKLLYHFNSIFVFLKIHILGKKKKSNIKLFFFIAIVSFIIYFKSII
jgi:hypothetical protein